MYSKFKSSFLDMVRTIYGDGNIRLHRPIFDQTDIDYVVEYIKSNFVSSVGKNVTQLKESISSYTGSRYGVAIVNGASGLHATLVALGVKIGMEINVKSFGDEIRRLQSCDSWDKSDLLALFHWVLPDFKHQETGKYLDSRM